MSPFPPNRWRVSSSPTSTSAMRGETNASPASSRPWPNEPDAPCPKSFPIRPSTMRLSDSSTPTTPRTPNCSPPINAPSSIGSKPFPRPYSCSTTPPSSTSLATPPSKTTSDPSATAAVADGSPISRSPSIPPTAWCMAWSVGFRTSVRNRRKANRWPNVGAENAGKSPPVTGIGRDRAGANRVSLDRRVRPGGGRVRVPGRTHSAETPPHRSLVPPSRIGVGAFGREGPSVVARRGPRVAGDDPSDLGNPGPNRCSRSSGGVERGGVGDDDSPAAHAERDIRGHAHRRDPRSRVGDESAGRGGPV